MDGASAVVRTILAIDDVAQTMTFAGDVPQGAYARLMKANFDRLIRCGPFGKVILLRELFHRLDDGPADFFGVVGRGHQFRDRVGHAIDFPKTGKANARGNAGGVPG